MILLKDNSSCQRDKESVVPVAGADTVVTHCLSVIPEKKMFPRKKQICGAWLMIRILELEGGLSSDEDNLCDTEACTEADTNDEDVKLLVVTLHYWSLDVNLGANIRRICIVRKNVLVGQILSQGVVDTSLLPQCEHSKFQLLPLFCDTQFLPAGHKIRVA